MYLRAGFGDMKIALPIICGAAVGATIAMAVDDPGVLKERDPLEATQAAYKEAIDGSDGDEAELASVRQDLALAYQRLGKENQSLLNRQVEIERSDPIAKEILDELLEAEKEVRQLRSRLKNRLGAIDEFQALDKKRQELVSEVEDLRRLERDLMEQLKKSTTEERSE